MLTSSYIVVHVGTAQLADSRRGKKERARERERERETVSGDGHRKVEENTTKTLLNYTKLLCKSIVYNG